MKAIRLRTEYLDSPLGMDLPSPRLSWNCEGCLRQTAYRIRAFSRGELVWDSGRVPGGRMSLIPYAGRPLQSRERIDWCVTLWDENDLPGDSAASFFETGLLSSDDWQARWIRGDYRVQPSRRYPVDCFRKLFKAEPVVRARLYATACGVYEAALNGARVGNFILAPGHTDYRKRVQYQVYDVTELITEGENELSFQLADGWYRGSCGAWGLRNQYGTTTKLLAQLELEYADGRTQIIATDESFSWSNDGPLRFADNQDGESVDARCTPGYSGHARLTAHRVTPTASLNVPITEHERFSPVLIRTPSGKTVLDFGQNIAGYLAFSLDAREGQSLCLRFGEMLDEDGEFTQKNIQCTSKTKTTPLQEVRYLCRDGRNIYKTRFAIFGFRYVQAETELSLSSADFTAIAVYSGLETSADFSSSNELLNAFFRATLWSAKNNSADVPTDCPTRERHGWTGDSQLFCRTASYLLNYYPFARKHLRDLCDWQHPNGAFPQIAPAGGVDFYMNTLNGSVGWADAGILIPYRLWKQYGDPSILGENYAAMTRYARFMLRRCGRFTPLSKPLGLSLRERRWAVNCGQSYGEWAEPAEVAPNDWRDMVFPHPEVSTAYTSFIMAHMAEIADALGKPDDAAFYRDRRDKIRASYRALRRTAAFSLDTDRQALLVRPLYMELLDEPDKAYARARLLKALDHFGWRLGTGFLSTPFILYVLSDFDTEAAYRLLENEEMPGWLFMPRMGATTIWESWEGTEAQGGIASLDHYSKGACLEWVFSRMCGIQPDGENHFLLTPLPGGSFRFASLRYRSVYGEISLHWERTEEGYRYLITVPANCTATLLLPGEDSRELDPGSFVFIGH